MTRIASIARQVVLLDRRHCIVASASVASAQQSFKSPEDAVGGARRRRQGQVAARRDRRARCRTGADIVSSGDEVADDAMRSNFSPPTTPSIR